MFVYLLAIGVTSEWTMRIPRITALCMVVSVASACGGSVPTVPSPSIGVSGLSLLCSSPTVLAGDLVVCMARASSTNVSFDAVWSSSDPAVARSEGFGLFVGKAEGQAILTATYSGKSVTAPVTVHLEDMLRVTAAAYQGTFAVGTTATVWLQGPYGVASAPSGTLALVVTDQTGTVVSRSAALVVPRGGDSYLITTTFTVPQGATRLCRSAVLEIGARVLTVVPESSLVPCFTVTP
jgi:hypothetical protein